MQAGTDNAKQLMIIGLITPVFLVPVAMPAIALPIGGLDAVDAVDDDASLGWGTRQWDEKPPSRQQQQNNNNAQHIYALALTVVSMVAQPSSSSFNSIIIIIFWGHLFPLS